MLNRGHVGAALSDRVPHSVTDTLADPGAGLIVISLGVDKGDHDEVHYDVCQNDAERVLTEAIDALVASRDALKSARLA